jgi:hypothetical protein
MNILEMVFDYDSHWRPSNADFSASEISGSSNYQLWLAKQGTEKTHKIPIELQMSSRLGTGFHLLAEEALKGTPNVITETRMCEKIGDYMVSGTPDVVYLRDDMWIIGDYKTKGTYQMRKAIMEGVDDVKVQMSIYAYLWSKYMDKTMPILGEVYLLHVGDKGYYTKPEVEKLGLTGRVPVPKYFTATVDLHTAEEVEEIVKMKAESILEEPLVDCADWKCNYCSFECEHRDKDRNEDF